MNFIPTCVDDEFPTVIIGEKGTDPFPCINNIWALYSKKATKTIFVSVGDSQSCLADLDLAETLGCAIHVVATSPTGEEKWNEVRRILKTRERVDAKFDFSMGADDKWVLEKNIIQCPTLGYWNSSTLDISGFSLKTEPFFDWMSTICQQRKLGEDVRLDILKVDMPNGSERSFLMSMLECGFRPATLLVKWESMPNIHTPTTLAAGHLQMCGYKLIRMIDNKFLYFYIDQDWYMTSNWEDVNCPNPLIREIAESFIQKSKQHTEDKNNNASYANKSLAAQTQANTITESKDKTPSTQSL